MPPLPTHLQHALVQVGQVEVRAAQRVNQRHLQKKTAMEINQQRFTELQPAVSGSSKAVWQPLAHAPLRMPDWQQQPKPSPAFAEANHCCGCPTKQFDVSLPLPQQCSTAPALTVFSKNRSVPMRLNVACSFCGSVIEARVQSLIS